MEQAHRINNVAADGLEVLATEGRELAGGA
jgi:hypothetical protein